MSWFDENMPGGGYNGRVGEFAGAVPGLQAPPPEAAPIEQPAAPQFNVQGAQVHGRAADTHDLNDLIYIASQQQGFDTSTPEATQRTFDTIFRPLLAQQGYGGAQLVGNNLDKISVGGRVIDFAGNAAGGERRLQAVEDGGGGGGPMMGDPGAMGGGGLMAGANLPLGGGGGGYNAGGGGAGSGAALHQEFKLPTLADMEGDPGYQFGLREGIGALENSASSRGMLRHPNTRQGLVQWGNDYASTKYNDLVQRKLAEAGFNEQGRLGEFGANLNAELGRGNLGLGFYRAGNDFSLGQGQLALGNKQADNSYSLGMGNLGLGWAGHGLAQQGQTFNQGYSMARLGLDAAGMAGGYGSAYGANAGNLITGQGNANAAGQIGAANALTGALGNIGNTAMGAAGYYYGY